MGERKELLCDVWIEGIPRESESFRFAKSVQETVAPSIPDQITEPDTLSLRIDFQMEDIFTCDIDNLCAVILNALYQGPTYIIHDDNLVANLEATKTTATEEKTHIQIWMWKS